MAREPIMLAVPAGHRVAGSADVELRALRDETLVDLPAGWGIRMAVDRSFAAAGVTRAITYKVNDTATMVEFIRNNRDFDTLLAGGDHHSLPLTPDWRTAQS